VVSLRGSLLGRWPALDLGEHINHFVPSTLDRLLMRSGFSPAKRFFGMYKGVESIAINAGSADLRRGGWYRQQSRSQLAHMTIAYGVKN